MEYLYWLQQLREGAPKWLNEAFLFISEFIGGTGGLVLMAFVYWCLSKRAGAFLMMNFSLAYVSNTVIKNIFCVSRPFNLDARLTPYVSATGYSLPSGHTMLATGVYGGIAVWQRKRKWLAALCVLMAFVTAFSRNWLGVHTIEDVLVAIACSAGVIALNAWMLQWADGKSGRDWYILAGAAAVFAAFCFLYPADLKTAGIYGGVMFGWFIERRFIRFEICGGVLFRGVTFAGGIAVVALLNKVILPIPCAALPENAAALLINLITFLTVTAGWPMVIKLLSGTKLAKR